MNRSVGVILVVVGLAIIVWGAFGFTTRETVVNIGPIHATRDKEHKVPYGTAVGGLILVGGAVMIANGKK